jgi:hypothetical protein
VKKTKSYGVSVPNESVGHKMQMASRASSPKPVAQSEGMPSKKKARKAKIAAIIGKSKKKK